MQTWQWMQLNDSNSLSTGAAPAAGKGGAPSGKGGKAPERPAERAAPAPAPVRSLVD